MARPRNPNSRRSRILAAIEANPGLRPVELLPLVSTLEGDPPIRIRDIQQLMWKLRVKEEGREARMLAISKMAEERVQRKAAAILGLRRKPRDILPPVVEPTVRGKVVQQHPDDVVNAVMAQALDPTERMHMLAKLAATAEPSVVIRALEKIDELQTRSGAVSSLPKPESEAEEDSRVALILEAIGKERAERCMILAFTPKAAPAESEAPESLPEDNRDALEARPDYAPTAPRPSLADTQRGAGAIRPREVGVV